MIPIKTEAKKKRKKKNRLPTTLQHHTTVQVKLKLVLYALLESPVCLGSFPLLLLVLGQKWWSNCKESELRTAGNAQFVIELEWEQSGVACREMAWMFVLALCKSVTEIGETPLCSEFRLEWSSWKYIY
jgi:hypothetical protein